jgi:hypothetical protein
MEKKGGKSNGECSFTVERRPAGLQSSIPEVERAVASDFSGAHRTLIGVLSSPQLRRLTACVNTVVLARVVSATPPSIVIVALVLGGPERVRVVLNSSSSRRNSRRNSRRCQLRWRPRIQHACTPLHELSDPVIQPYLRTEARRCADRNRNWCRSASSVLSALSVVSCGVLEARDSLVTLEDAATYMQATQAVSVV